jgi:hypothetical protein
MKKENMYRTNSANGEDGREGEIPEDFGTAGVSPARQFDLNRKGEYMYSANGEDEEREKPPNKTKAPKMKNKLEYFRGHGSRTMRTRRAIK